MRIRWADVVDIRWSADGRFVHTARIAPGRFVELCAKLAAESKVAWAFKADSPVDFNVHYHVDKDVMFAFKLAAVTAARDTLQVNIAQDYCWMWRNPSLAPIRLTVTLLK